MQLYLFVIL
ncbi:putative membrane protein, partial [Yersinia pestis PY-100]